MSRKRVKQVGWNFRVPKMGMFQIIWSIDGRVLFDDIRKLPMTKPIKFLKKLVGEENHVPHPHD